MTSRANFAKRVSGGNAPDEIRRLRRRIARLETRLGIDANLASVGDGIINHDVDGVTYVAGPYPETAIHQWVTDDTGEKIARLLGYFLSSGTFSGLEIDVIAKAGSTGDLVLAAFTETDDVDVDPAQAAVHIRSDGKIILYIAGVAVMELNSSFALTSGTYTPTLTNGLNCAASTPRVTQYYRVGKMVTVFGNLDADPTAGSSNTGLLVSLPIASNFANGFELGGNGTVHDSTQDRAGVSITGDTINDQAAFAWFSPDNTNRTISFIFSYQVI
jgi:hypothetical protein